jgi:hypothetical protein
MNRSTNLAAIADLPPGTPDAAPQMRCAEFLMKPERLSLLQTSRVSATRLLMGKAIRERWKIEKRTWNIDDRARGTALYRIETPTMPFDFIIHSFEPRTGGRMGRIIGRVWDMMAALVEGPTSAADVRITGEEIHKLYAGRATPGTLIWARSNRSGRAFDHTVESLAAGRQPNVPTLAEACYLMRNTGLDGNGTFGTRSFRALEDTHPLRRPLDAQMLCAYMMRVFSIDLAHHLARCRNASATTLAPEIQRFLGVGNGSALGLNFFVNNHPQLLDAWITAREQAIVGAKRLPLAPHDPKLACLLKLLDRATVFRREDRMEYERFLPSAVVADDLAKIRAAAQELFDTGEVDGGTPRYPLAALADSIESKVNGEAFETFLGLATELVPELCDRLAETLSVEEEFVTEPDMSIGRLRDLLRTEYAWAFGMELDSESANRYVWYKSETAEEPRRGLRSEVGDVFNLALDLPRLVRGIDAQIARRAPSQSVAHFLLELPQYRFVVSRIQTLSGLQYHSPHMNMMGEALIPCDITRLINITIHGLDKTRDYLQRALRGVIYQGAPTVEDLASGADSDWFYPAEPVL